MSNFYKDPKTGDVFCYDDGQVASGVVRKGLVEMTKSEITKHLAAPAPTTEQVDALRLTAYAHPVTGCDRYHAEAAAERLRGNDEGAKAAEEKLLSRREEIKIENPWPEV